MEILQELLLKEQERLEQILRKTKDRLADARRGRFVYPVAEKMSSIITARRGIEKTAPIFPRNRQI